MFRFLVTHSLRNRLFVLAAALALVVYGLFTISKLPVDVFPELTDRIVGGSAVRIRRPGLGRLYRQFHLHEAEHLIEIDRNHALVRL